MDSRPNFTILASQWQWIQWLRWLRAAHSLVWKWLIIRQNLVNWCLSFCPSLWKWSKLSQFVCEKFSARLDVACEFALMIPSFSWKHGIDWKLLQLIIFMVISVTFYHHLNSFRKHRFESRTVKFVKKLDEVGHFLWQRQKLHMSLLKPLTIDWFHWCECVTFWSSQPLCLGLFWSKNDQNLVKKLNKLGHF